MSSAERHHIIFPKLNLSNKRNEIVDMYLFGNVKTFYRRRIIVSAIEGEETLKSCCVCRPLCGKV